MPQRRNRSGDDPNLEPLVDASLTAFFSLKPRTQLVMIVVLAVAGIIGFLVYRHTQQSPFFPAPTMDSVDLTLGNPSNATADVGAADNYLMVKPYFALAYNSSLGTPSWVSWRVTEADLGDAPRKDEFDTDNDLPAAFYHVTQQDYSGSGFDRGHLCPHGDRTANLEMSYATFVMTNMTPQAPNLNRKAWEQLEDYCRGLVRQHDRLYIIAGPVGQGGRGSRGMRTTLANGHVVVPRADWKVIVAIPDEGSDSLTQIGPNTRVLTVEMPNDNDVLGDEWAQFRITPAQIERETGLHFFTKLSPAIAETLRNKVDQLPIPPPRPTEHYSR